MMILLVGFALLSGIVTVLSPCILPVLPIILSSSFGKAKPLGVVTGFVASFTFFTLFLSSLVRISGVSVETLRLLSIFVVAGFGLSLLIPQIQVLWEKMFAKLAGHNPGQQNKTGFWGGFLIGLSVGLLWTPCVGPILAAVISLAVTGTVTFETFVITLAYALGTAMPMLVIMQGGQKVLHKVPWLLPRLGLVQKAFGMVMIVTAVGIFFNIDRKFQTFVLQTFPQYGAGLTKLEDNEVVQKQLNSKASNKGLKAPELIPGGQWFNSEPLTLSALKGKVVVLDFWTYSCINCQRTLPYLRKWWEKYKDKGLVIIGVHAPEFEFEKNPKNVAQAISDFKLTYPVVQDNNFATWRAYDNHYWPAKYFIDKEGTVRSTHFGEGDYDESERIIQELLKETGVSDLPSEINNPDYQIYARTPETYLGYGRMEELASNERIAKDRVMTYSALQIVPKNLVAFSGDFKVTAEYANPQAGAKLLLNFESKEVFLVMRTTGKPAVVKVFVDDVLTKDITVAADKLYKLVDLPTPGRHMLRLEFEDGNAEVYAFTFG